MKYTLFIFILILAGCQPEPAPVDPIYAATLQAWHQEREMDMVSEGGWLNLAGLYWLQEGKNTFGSSDTNDVVFPKDVPAFMGVFELDSAGVQVHITPNVDVLYNEQSVTGMMLKPDVTGEPTVLTHGPFRWFVIERDNRTGIRLRNLESEHVKQFAGIQTFPIDPSWRVTATLERYDSLRTIAIPTILGTVRSNQTPGRLRFEKDGQTYHLTPVQSEGDLFLIFADATTGRETYGGGRFLHVDLPDEAGQTIIDFNKAYNPPCAFSEYSTCPQPPAENRLNIAIEAGEKDYH